MKFKLLILFLWFFISVLLGFDKFPEPVGWVNDFAGVLSENNKAELTNWLAELKQKTDVEMAIAIFADIGGTDYSNFATDLFRAWRVGNKKDEGILLLIAVQERKIKFEVGYGSEAYLTDLYTNTALEKMREFLHKGNDKFDEAVRQATLLILNRIAQEKGVQITGMPVFRIQSESKNTKQGLSSIFLIIIFIFLVIITRGRIIYWLLLASVLGGGRSGGFGGHGSGGFGGFGGFGGGRSGGGGAGGGF